MYKPEEDRYNKYGRLKDRVLDNIEEGDTVCYVDSRNGQLPNGRFGTTKVEIFGLWDGSKVQFYDDQFTLVRSTEWLKLIKKKNEK